MSKALYNIHLTFIGQIQCARLCASSLKDKDNNIPVILGPLDTQ